MQYAPSRETYVQHVSHTLWENLPRMIQGALLFNLDLSACGGPVLLQAFRRYRPRCALFNLLCLIPVVALYTTLTILPGEDSFRAAHWMGLGAEFLGIAIKSMVSLYAYPCLVYRELELGACLRDSLILASRYPMHSVGLLALGVLLGFPAANVSWALLHFLPAVYGIFIAGNFLAVLEAESRK